MTRRAMPPTSVYNTGPTGVPGRYGFGPLKRKAVGDAPHERRFVFDQVVVVKDAGRREKLEANRSPVCRTRDGVTTETAEETGKEATVLFGSNAERVANSWGWYNPRWHYEHDDETHQALDLLFSGHFNRDLALYTPIRDALLTQGDYYMHLADLASYTESHSRVSDLYADRRGWARKSILNVAWTGKFSSARAIMEYAEGIWGATRCEGGE